MHEGQAAEAGGTLFPFETCKYVSVLLGILNLAFAFCTCIYLQCITVFCFGMLHLQAISGKGAIPGATQLLCTNRALRKMAGLRRLETT